MVKVLHFELSEFIGGIESFLLNVTESIDRKKVNFDFATVSVKPAYGDRLSQLGCNVIKLPSYYEITNFVKSMRRLLIKNKYDIVHFHKNSLANIIPILLVKKYSDAKIIIHSHNTSPSKGKITFLLHKLNCNRALKISDCNLACSDAAGKWMFKKQDFEIIHNGVQMEKFLFNNVIRAEKRKEFGISDSTVVVGHVGRFTEQKNHRRIIEIFDSVVKFHEDSVLLLVGEGELQIEIMKMCKDRKLISKVIMANKREDVHQLMQAMDIFLLPSFYEGLPIVAVEAQVAALPVFLSDTITNEVALVKNAKFMSLYDDNDTWAKEILNAVNNSDRQEEVKNTIIKQGYDIVTTARRLCELYEQEAKEN